VANNQLAFFGKYYRTQHVNVWKVSVEYDGTGDCAEAPLSWKLDSTQQDCIQRTWRDDVQVKQSTALACIKSYVNGDKDLAGKCSRADDPDKD
jgi:hypothetical protein